MALTPHVYWAQRHDDIYLRVELTDAQNISVKVHENVLRFRGQGRGAKGHNEYEFSLEFLLPVKPEISYKSTQRQVNITLQKEQRGWWEKLSVHQRKPVFLVPDFDRWLDESDDEMEIREREEKLKVKRGPDNVFVNPKLGFLFSYNLVQFLGFSWIFINMTVRLFIFGQDFLYDTFHSISKVVFFCQILASVEVLNAAFGVVRTQVLPTLLQVIGRNFILFIIFGSLEEMQNKPVVFFVFYLWSSIEIIRYPFYLLSYCDIEWKTLTWLRYTVWIPLYPLGALAEAVAVIQAIPMFDETKLFSVRLPKPIGSSISFSFVLYIYLVVMVWGLCINLRHLYKLRMKRIRTKKKTT